MKKNLTILFAILMVCSFMLAGCSRDNNGAQAVSKDYSEFPFSDISWKREGAHDLETIFFGADGCVYYSCACGNPVRDFDLCENYRYDDQTRTITLSFIEKTEDTPDVIKIIKFFFNRFAHI